MGTPQYDWGIMCMLGNWVMLADIKVLNQVVLYIFSLISLDLFLEGDGNDLK